jgi:hypothetical protein
MSMLSEASAPIALANRVIRELEAMHHILRRLLELEQSPRRNFLAAGTIAGAGAVGTTPLNVMPANPHRRGLYVKNTVGTGRLTIGLGVTQPSDGVGIVLAPGETWNGLVSDDLWLGSVTVIGSQSGVTYSWLQASGPSGARNEAIG